MEYVLGLDLGTTSIKLVAFSLTAEVTASFSAANPIYEQADGSRVTDADDVVGVVEALICKMHELIPAKLVAGIGISTAMFSILPVSSQAAPLAPVRSWADGVKQTLNYHEHAEFYSETGCRMSSIYPIFKICRCRQDQPELRHRDICWVSLAEYVYFKLTGEWLVSRSIASCSGLMNVHTLSYHQPALDWAGIAANQLSPLVDEHTARPVNHGVYAGVPLVIGATDGPLCHYGTNSLSENQMTSTIGTSAAVRVVKKHPVLDPDMRTWCYYLGNQLWAVGGAVNGGGIALQWLQNNLMHSTLDVDDMVNDALSSTEPGADGLVIIPELMGERCPGWNDNMRGAIYGLSLQHTSQHVVRAIIEGICYRLLLITQIVQQIAALDTMVVRASGGYAKNANWVQLQADVFGSDVQLPIVTEASALGAACFAAQGSGLMSAEQLANKVAIGEVYYADGRKYRMYHQAYSRSNALWEAVTYTFAHE